MDDQQFFDYETVEISLERLLNNVGCLEIGKVQSKVLNLSLLIAYNNAIAAAF